MLSVDGKAKPVMQMMYYMRYFTTILFIKESGENCDESRDEGDR